MKQVKILKKISPFNNLEKMSATVYIIKKSLAFLMIYCSSAIIGEAITIGSLYFMGYDPLHGVMPAGRIKILLPYYGFSIFLLITVLYCILIEKKGIKFLGYNKKVTDYFLGCIIAMILLAIIISLCCMTNAIVWEGISGNSDNIYLICLWIGFIIQSAGEETLTRGFLLHTLVKKVSVPMAIFVSSTAFVLPHLFTMFEADTKYVVIGIANLYLISIIFSLLVLSRSNIWIACGLHSIWNFILYGIMGLSLSGSEINSDSIMKFIANSATILNGGIYGIEASIITTLVLGAVVILLKYCQDRRCKHEL